MLRLNLRFRAAVRFHSQPTLVLAKIAGVDAQRLEDLTHEKCMPTKNDPTVLKVAELLGFRSEDCFIEDGIEV